MAYNVNVLEQLIADRANKNNKLSEELINSVTEMQKYNALPRALGEFAKFYTDRPGVNQVDVTGAFPTMQQDQVVKTQLAGQIGKDDGLTDIYKTKMAALAAMNKSTTASDNERDLYKDFRSDPFVKSQQESMAAAGRLKGLIDQNNPAAYQTFKTMLIRFGGDNRPSDYDIKSAGGSQALADRWDQWVEKISTGKWSEENVDLYKKMMNSMYNTLQRNLNQSVDTFVNNAPVVYKVDKDTARKVLTGIAGQGSATFDAQPTPQAPAETGQPQATMTREQMIAAIKAKRGS